MSVNINILAVPPSVSAQIVTASNSNLQQAFTRHVVHDGTNLGYKNHVRGFGEVYFFGNAVATPVSVVNTNYQFQQSVYTVNPLSVNFDTSGYGLRYLGIPGVFYPVTGVFYVHANLNALSSATSTQLCSFYLALNGTIQNNTKCSQSIENSKSQNGTCSAIMSLSTNDIVTLWMANNTVNNAITITDLSFEAFALN